MTDAELWDYLQERFGFGEWDEHTSDVPWWQFRANEIGKLKRMMRRRRVVAVQLTTAADYALAHRKPITGLWQLFALIPEAMAALRRQERLDQQAVLAEEVNDVMHEAWEAGDTEMAGRLMRASTADAQTLINEWRNR
jgi:hypothetical protein